MHGAECKCVNYLSTLGRGHLETETLLLIGGIMYRLRLVEHKPIR
jgi:hypothetical protein